MACRDVTRATQAMDDIKSELSGVENTGELVVKKLDLNSLQSVRECAQDIIKDEKNIHILINNAGLYFFLVYIFLYFQLFELLTIPLFIYCFFLNLRGLYRNKNVCFSLLLSWKKKQIKFKRFYSHI